MADEFRPRLPPGREVELPGRGRTFVRELAGPPGAPTVLLLHGWTATADLNWLTTYAWLSRSFGVVALDQRGHGRGIRSRRPFRLSDCADDAAALVDELGWGPVIACGYSMGGAVAQLLARRHPQAARGLVLCATSRTFAGSAEERMWFAAMGGAALAARATPRWLQRRLAARFVGRPGEDETAESWVLGEMHRHDWAAILEAGRALGRFDSRSWVGALDLPVAVVATMADEVVAPARQLALARSIPGATLHPVQGDHTVCGRDAARFVPVLVDACRSVASRSLARPA